MIKITKSEKEALLQNCPGTHIRRTMNQRSKRHRYYCEESPAVMDFLLKRRKAGA